jgi:hypothetical protein
MVDHESFQSSSEFIVLKLMHFIYLPYYIDYFYYDLFSCGHICCNINLHQSFSVVKVQNPF